MGWFTAALELCIYITIYITIHILTVFSGNAKVLFLRHTETVNISMTKTTYICILPERISMANLRKLSNVRKKIQKIPLFIF